ncbi:MAG: Gfo/Idh/MocA family protein [Chloroflexota bacterium]
MNGRMVRVGIIGAGDFAEVCHIPGIQAHPRGEVAALCARNRDRVAALGARLGVSDTYTDYHDLLARDDIDAVTIAGPDALHGPATLAALAAGKHVFCEKPLAMDAAEAERMVEACARSGRVGMVSYTFRYGHALRELRRLLGEGAIGIPCHVAMQVHWGYAGYPGPVLTPSYDRSTESSSGAWADAATHLFDALAYVLAPPRVVCAQMMIVPREPGTAQPDTVDIAGCLVRLDLPSLAGVAVGQAASFADREPGAVHAFLFANRLDRGPNEIQIVGTRGAASMALTRGEHERLSILRADHADWEEVALPTDAYTEQPRALARMMGAFIDAVLRGRLDPEHDPSFADGLRAQRAIDAALASARGGQWQEVRER